MKAPLCGNALRRLGNWLRLALKSGIGVYAAAMCLTASSQKPVGTMKFESPMLLGTQEITLDKLRDAKTGEWFLYPFGPERAPKPSEMRVGIIDSGIAQAHPQIQGTVLHRRTGLERVSRTGSVMAQLSPCGCCTLMKRQSAITTCPRMLLRSRLLSPRCAKAMAR